MEILFLGAIILVALVLFVTELFPIDVTALLVLGLLLILGLVSPAESLAGFSNPAVITIACLFILSHALQKSHILEYLIININSLIDRSRVLGMIAYLFAIGVASAVVNNTAIVAIFMPVTIRLADKYNISPSKVLIPLSYAAILGGTLTLVGTSTNLIVNSILVDSSNGQVSLGMLEFAKFGIIKFVIGLLYIFTIGYKLLPIRVAKSSSIEDYRLDGYLTEFKVSKNSPLTGKTLLDRKINENYDVIILDVLRNGEIINSIKLEEEPFWEIYNNDWEDITADKDYIFIADTGNNFGNRDNLNIIKVRTSDFSVEGKIDISAMPIVLTFL